MTPDHLRNSELDKLLRHTLESNIDLTVPQGLSDRIIRKLEKKALLQELILELSFKIGLVLVSLAVLAGVLVWSNGSSLLGTLYTHFIDNWQVIISVLFVVFITILIDQVGLRFYNTFEKAPH